MNVVEVTNTLYHVIVGKDSVNSLSVTIGCFYVGRKMVCVSEGVTATPSLSFSDGLSSVLLKV